MLSIFLAAFTLHGTTTAYRMPALRTIIKHSRYNRLVLYESPPDNMLGEQLQELIEGVEKFQEQAYSSVYGKDIKWKSKVSPKETASTTPEKKAPVVASPQPSIDKADSEETLSATEAAPVEPTIDEPKAEPDVKAAVAEKKPAQSASKVATKPAVAAKPAVAKPAPVIATPVVPSADKFAKVIPASESDVDVIAEGVALRDVEEGVFEEPVDDEVDVLRAQQGLAQLFLSNTKSKIVATPETPVRKNEEASEPAKPSGGLFGMFSKSSSPPAAQTQVVPKAPEVIPAVAAKATPVPEERQVTKPAAKEAPAEPSFGLFSFLKSDPNIIPRPSGPPTVAQAFQNKPVIAAPKVEEKPVAKAEAPVVKTTKEPAASSGGLFGMFGKKVTPIVEAPQIAAPKAVAPSPAVEEKRPVASAVAKEAPAEPSFGLFSFLKSDPNIIPRPSGPPTVAQAFLNKPVVAAPKAEEKPVAKAEAPVVKAEPAKSSGGLFGMFGQSTPPAVKAPETTTAFATKNVKPEVKAAPKSNLNVKTAASKPPAAVVPPKVTSTPSTQATGGLFGFLSQTPAKAEFAKPVIAAPKVVVKTPEPPKPVVKVVPPKAAGQGMFGFFGKPSAPSVSESSDAVPKKVVAPAAPVSSKPVMSTKIATPKPVAKAPLASVKSTPVKPTPVVAKPVAKAPEPPKVVPKVVAPPPKPTPIAKPPTAMNSKFITMVTSILGANSAKLKAFQQSTNDYRSGVKSVSQYYVSLTDLFGEENIASIVEPLILELPEKDLASGLKAEYTKATKKEEKSSFFGFFGGSKKVEDKVVDAVKPAMATKASVKSVVAPSKTSPTATVNPVDTSKRGGTFSFLGSKASPVTPSFIAPSKLPAAKKTITESQFKAAYEGTIELKAFYDGLVKSLGKPTLKLVFTEISEQFPKDKSVKLNAIFSADK